MGTPGSAPRRVGGALAHPPDERLLEERRHEHVIGDRPLDLMEQRLALLSVQFLRLALEQVFELGQGPVGVETVLGTKGSSRAAALPAAPVAPMRSPFSFFSRQLARKAACSIVLTRVLMPTA